MLYNIYTIGDKTQTVLATIDAVDSFDAYSKLLNQVKAEFGLILDPQTLIAFPIESTEA